MTSRDPRREPGHTPQVCQECAREFTAKRRRACCGPRCTRHRRERLRGFSDATAYRKAAGRGPTDGGRQP